MRRSSVNGNGPSFRALARAAACAAAFVLSSCNLMIGTMADGTIFDHGSADVRALSAVQVNRAKSVLNIAYWHTSHGSQISTGIAEMDAFYGGTGLYAVGGPDSGPGALRIDDHGDCDIGNSNGGPAWDERTRTYLAEHPSVNVVMWAWCGQVSSSTPEDIDAYLGRMSDLERSYPGVRFVYMTGHADGTGPDGNLAQRDAQIRRFCEENHKFLYDFYDIDCHDPDGNDFSARNVADSCAYDGGNWALEWQSAHPGQWWACGSAHSEPLNANQKAKAAWRLWVALARTL